MCTAVCRILLALCLALPWVVSSAGAENWGLNEVFDAPRAFEAVQDMTLRSRPDKNSESVGAVRQGEIVSVSGLENGWFKVTRSSGTVGFIYQRFLKASQAPLPEIGSASQDPFEATATPATTAGEPGLAPAASTGETSGPGEAHEVPSAPAPDSQPTQPQQDATVLPPNAGEAPTPASPPVPSGSAVTNAVTAGQPVPGGSAVSSVDAKALPSLAASAVSGADASVEVRPKTGGTDCYRLTLNEITATGSVRNTLAHAVQDCYLLALLPNQWFEVWISSSDNSAVFELFSSKGVSLIRDEMHWLGRTDVGGDYIVLVNSRKGKTEYTLKVQVR